MSKLKMPRTSPALDMTPMVDLAFLLVTFFMLTAQFRPEEAVLVDTPSSMSQSPIPTENLMTVTVDSSGRVFWDFTDRMVRGEVIKEMANRYHFDLDAEQVQRFINLNDIGIPVQQLPAYLALDTPAERKQMDQASPGIPIDSTNNQPTLRSGRAGLCSSTTRPPQRHGVARSGWCATRKRRWRPKSAWIRFSPTSPGPG